MSSTTARMRTSTTPKGACARCRVLRRSREHLTAIWTGYLYDAAGNRVAKGSISTMSCDITTNGFTQTAGYVVGPSGEQLTEVDADDVTTANPSGWAHTNVYAGGKLIGTYDGNVNAPTLHFHFDDPLGTRRVQTDSVGNIEQTYQSLPYGEMPTDQPLGATENHFTGKERDTESGNDYFGARYYNSNTGRFLSPDWSAKVQPVPYSHLDDPQSLNLYAYVLNNPMDKVDLDGHDPAWWQKIRNKIHGDGYKTDAQLAPPPPGPPSPLPANAAAFTKQGMTIIYSQSTGKAVQLDTRGNTRTLGDGKPGYAGIGSGKNNPYSQSIGENIDRLNAGPLPRGNYDIGSQQNHTTSTGVELKGALPLFPESNVDLTGRDNPPGFWIHGDSKINPGKASEGCPFLILVRETIYHKVVSRHL